MSPVPGGSVAARPSRRADADVVVVGGGPAGSLTALLAARQGLDTLLVERTPFPRWKVCGACLGAPAQALLRELGLGHLVATAPPLHELAVSGWGRQARIRVQGSVALRRSVLDAGLLDGAREAGVRVLEGSVRGLGETASRGPGNDVRVLPVRTADGIAEVAGRVVVVAAGLAGLRGDGEEGTPWVAADARIGVGAAFPADVGPYGPGVVHMVAGDAGYVGLVRTEEGGLNVAGALDPDFVREHGGPGPAVAAHLAAAGAPELPPEPIRGWQGTPALTRRPGAVAGAGYLVVGDAAGYVEPFTGEGMSWALGGARALAPLLPGAVAQGSPAVEAAWRRIHRERVGSRHRVCRAVTWLSRRPWAGRAALGVLSRAPWLARPLSGRTARPFDDFTPILREQPS